jgi:hypothetical protein
VGLAVVIKDYCYLEWSRTSAVPDRKQRKFAHFLPHNEEEEKNLT